MAMTMSVARVAVSGSGGGTCAHASWLERTAEREVRSGSGLRTPSSCPTTRGRWSPTASRDLAKVGKPSTWLSITRSSDNPAWTTTKMEGRAVAFRSSSTVAAGSRRGWSDGELNGLAGGRGVVRRLKTLNMVGLGAMLGGGGGGGGGGEENLLDDKSGRRRQTGTRAESMPPPRSSKTATNGASEQATTIHVVDAPTRTPEKVLQDREGLVTLGLPKGSLQQATADLFSRAGYNIKIHERSYLPDVDDKDLNVVLFRGQEISRYVEDGVLDAGICGHDWVVENGSDVKEVCELNYSKATARPVRWVLAVPETSKVQSIQDLAGGIIATELIKTTERYFQKQGVVVQKVEYSWGATEVKALLPGVQAIVDITETGSSLRANKLRILDTILYSTTRLIANHDSWRDPLKREKIEDIAMLLQGAVAGRGKVGMKMNVERRLLDELVKMLPAAHSPTISPLLDDTYCAVEVVCSVAEAREILPKAKRLGADAIFTYPLDVLIR